MGKILKTSTQRLIQPTQYTSRNASGMDVAQPSEWLTDAASAKTGTSATFTSGPAARLHSVAPGRGGGSTYATPPSGHSTILSTRPPTCRQASACPNSCSVTITNSARYSAMFQPIEE